MTTFAIVRQDGECDKAEGASVQDVADRYGWPGNGTIEPWDEGKHGGNARHVFTTVADQAAALAETPADVAAIAPEPTGIYRTERDFEAAVAAESERRAREVGSPTWQPTDNGGQ